MPDLTSDLTVASDINVRSRSYWIARTVGACWHCRRGTCLIALALPPCHETLSQDGDVEQDGFAGEIWEEAGCNAILFYVEYLPAQVQNRLKRCSGSYRLAYSDKLLGSYWANHCEKCGSLLDDHELFCEPEGAFLPVSPASAAAIELIRIDEEIEAAAAGYSCDPEFFKSMVMA
jgi:hypothetical protein